MAEVIRLNAEGLTQASTQLKTQGNEFEEVILRIQNIINHLGECWEGEAANAYIEQFTSLKPSLEQTRQLVDDIALQIDQTLQAAQELDTTIASRLR